MNVIEFDGAMVMVIQPALGGPSFWGDQGSFPGGKNSLSKTSRNNRSNNSSANIECLSICVKHSGTNSVSEVVQ